MGMSNVSLLFEPPPSVLITALLKAGFLSQPSYFEDLSSPLQLLLTLGTNKNGNPKYCIFGRCDSYFL